MSSYLGPNIVTDGLVFYVDAGNIESYNNSSIFDLTSNNINGSLYNITVLNSWFVFDGISSEIAFPNNSIYKTPSITVDFFVNLDYEATGRHVMFTSWLGFTVEINNPSGAIVWGLYGPSNQYFGGNYTITYGQPAHIVCTFDDTSKSQMIYKNGIFLEGQTPTGSISYDTGTLRFSGSWDRTKGKMGGFKIYNRALSQPEVSQNYNALKSRYGM